jgi:hypothetical protein
MSNLVPRPYLDHHPLSRQVSSGLLSRFKSRRSKESKQDRRADWDRGELWEGSGSAWVSHFVDTEELLADELTNAIDEGGDGLIESLVAGALAAGGFDIGCCGPE